MRDARMFDDDVISGTADAILFERARVLCSGMIAIIRRSGGKGWRAAAAVPGTGVGRQVRQR